MTMLLSSAFVFGNVSTNAWSATEALSASQAQSVSADHKNQAPLPPAGVAGIKQAQGFVEEYPLLTISIVGGVVALVWILLDDDDDEEVPSTGTS